MCNPSAVAMHDGHCHLCQRLTMLKPNAIENPRDRENKCRLSSISLRERLPTTTQHFRKKIAALKQLPCESIQQLQPLLSGVEGKLAAINVPSWCITR